MLRRIHLPHGDFGKTLQSLVLSLLIHIFSYVRILHCTCARTSNDKQTEKFRGEVKSLNTMVGLFSPYRNDKIFSKSDNTIIKRSLTTKYSFKTLKFRAFLCIAFLSGTTATIFVLLFVARIRGVSKASEPFQISIIVGSWKRVVISNCTVDPCCKVAVLLTGKAPINTRLVFAFPHPSGSLAITFTKTPNGL